MEPENKLQNKSVQTYAEDMVKVIESSEGGLIKKMIHQDEQDEIEKKNLSPGSRKNKFFILASFIFIFLASGILAYLIVSKEEIGVVDVELQFTPIIFTDKTAFIEVAGLEAEKIAENVLNEINNAEVKEGGVEGIYLTENKKIIGFPRFLEIIKANVAKDKVGIFGDHFLLGATYQNTENVFILLAVQSFTDVFNEMHAWEDKMFYDLHDFFGVALDPEADYLLTKDFEDGIIQNKNARVLYDDSNKIVLMYVFVDDASIVITNTESAVSEVMARLAASRVKK